MKKQKVILCSADGTCKSKVMRIPLGATRMRTVIRPVMFSWINDRPVESPMQFREYEWQGGRDKKGRFIFAEIVP